MTDVTRLPVDLDPGSAGQRAVALRVARRRAGALLALVSLIFVAATVVGGHHAWAPWVQATAVAAMVGGLADWFAVTALFRRPLGLPIPHTAIVVERKDRFGATLAAFVRDNFLAADVVVERLASAAPARRLGQWAADPVNAALVADRLADGAVRLAAELDDGDVRRTLDPLVGPWLTGATLGPAAGRLLGRTLDSPGLAVILDEVLAGAVRTLDRHGDDLARRLGAGNKTPWWLPGPVEDRLAERLVARARTVLSEMAGHPDHPLRRQLVDGLAVLGRDLRDSPVTAERLDQAIHRLTDGRGAGALIDVWHRTRDRLAEPGGELSRRVRRAVADVVMAAGHRVAEDPSTAASLNGMVETAARRLLERHGDDLAGLVRGTVERWDAAGTARRLELLLGPDLQYIRINGTIVGGLAGLALHGVTRLLG